MTVVAELTGSPAIVAPGRLVAGRYRLGELLGRGGMGRVWLADDEVLRRRVALKEVVLSGLVSEDAHASALSEARAAARLDHVGAVRIHDLVEDPDGNPWIVMELLSGRTLAQALQAEGSLPVAEVRRIGLQLLDVLEAVHRAGLLHRDVKPANVFLCDDGRVVLTDFGIACTVDDTTLPPGGLAGSPAYMSPERARDDEIGPASDLFSLGATLFAAVEGRSPFGKGDPFSTLVAVVEDAPGPFVNAAALRPVIEGLLVKQPDKRLTATQARLAAA
ncbi:MAG TPA: serine/threonine-protein kinase [Kribbella sp.]|uniref:serine/threonine-protein kinase n=1 Tax=Kribbella sp. TaxID=1871183 RepID=UPI002D7672A4|nr:serine/threonine-protein kinase [Kribbella sp.]HET6294741.1 serine/threonine-protein kinase [Kribbella sp.]